MSDQPTRPNDETRAAERDEATSAAGADRGPTAEEAAIADARPVDPEAAEHEREMNELGAKQKGEGRTP
jgi:hypothetical protein